MESVVCFLNFKSYPVPVRGSKARYFPLVLHRKLMRAPEALSKKPGLEQCPSSKFFRQNNIIMSAVVGTGLQQELRKV
jgi:hypothetical protein